jgi:molybdate/tungstate transport system substrate-binding protein
MGPLSLRTVLALSASTAGRHARAAGSAKRPLPEPRNFSSAGLQPRALPSRSLQVTALALTLFVTSRAFAQQAVTVLYPGSLVGLMERSIRPAFKQQTGDEFQGHAGGSKALAMQIKEGSLRSDVFISADPKVNALLSGPKNGDRVKWYVTFAESPLVLGISPSSRFADEAKGRPWNELATFPQ